MINEIFNIYYTTDMYPERLTPLSYEELSKGMSKEAVSKYIKLIRRLYSLSWYDVNKTPITRSIEEENLNAVTRCNVFNALILHLFDNKAISISEYMNLFKDGITSFDCMEHPLKKGIYISDSFDDFRLSFEKSIPEYDDDIYLLNEYLADRYGYRFFADGICRIKDIKKDSVKTISYWDAEGLLQTIRKDLKRVSDDKKLFKSYFPPSKGLTLHKFTYSLPKCEAEWYTMARALEREERTLESLEYEVTSIFDSMKEPEVVAGRGECLYVYKGNIRCHLRKHLIESATAILYDKYNRKVKINVEYCPECKIYMINYISFEQQRIQHDGILIGNLKMFSTGTAIGGIELADESTLRLSGYNVSKSADLSVNTRKYILAKIIHDDIMKKPVVIHYLEHFIKVNGAKEDNLEACIKWKEDLKFVHSYNINTQPHVFIDKVKEY